MKDYYTFPERDFNILLRAMQESRNPTIRKIGNELQTKVPKDARNSMSLSGPDDYELGHLEDE